MAFGIKREELQEWKRRVRSGDVAFLTHYWLDERFPDMRTVTKVGCTDIEKLAAWGAQYGLSPRWIHRRSGYPHFDLLGERQVEILKAEGLIEQLERFRLGK